MAQKKLAWKYRNISIAALILAFIIGAGALVYKPRVPGNSPLLATGCEEASTIVNESILHSHLWQPIKVTPEKNTTLTGLPIIVKYAPNKPYVGYKSNMVSIFDLAPTEIPLTETMFTDLFTNIIIPQMQKNGYSLVHFMNSQQASALIPDMDIPTIYPKYVFQKGNELFQVAINNYDAQNPTMPQKASVEYLCALDMSKERTQYADILSYREFSPMKDAYGILTIWDVKDNAYAIGISSWASGGGYAKYIAKINGTFTSLYEGQEMPTCDVLEKNKVGYGFDCYDPTTTGSRTAAY